MTDINVEMNFCRRCGSKLRLQGGPVFKCEQGHTIFLNASPAVGLLLLNTKGEIVILERAIDPGKGLSDIPGGFCDGAESFEEAIAREVQEEIGLAATDYTSPEFLLSGIDYYAYGGEVLPVLGAMFTATLRTSAVPVAADDAATASFVPLRDVNLDNVYFPTVRAGIAWLQAHN